MKTPFFPRAGRLCLYFWLTYLALLVNTFWYVRQVEFAGILTPIFIGVIWLTHAMLYLLPILIIALALDGMFSVKLLGRIPRAMAIGNWIVYGVSLLGFSLVQNLIFTDKFIFRIYGFHLNGFVWNLVWTRGGIRSMGGNASTNLSVAAIVVAFLALQAALLAIVLRSSRVQAFFSRLFARRRRVVATVAVAVVLTLAQAVTYGVFTLKDYTPALVAAQFFPAHFHITFAHLAKKYFGIKTAKQQVFDAKTIDLKYPLSPLVVQPDAKKYNIVWLVAESWRKDMLAPDIMPTTWAFAQKSARFEQHYSGGNGTRMGMFSMFYGLYGPYWFEAPSSRATRIASCRL